jgi:hypothetical protein
MRFVFPALEHLAFSGWPESEPDVIEAILNLPRLKYMAIAQLNRSFISRSLEPKCLNGISKVFGHPTLQRVVLGLNYGADDYPFVSKHEAFRRNLEKLRPRNFCSVHIVFFDYGTAAAGTRKKTSWFDDRLVDGTLWDLEDPQFPG